MGVPRLENCRVCGEVFISSGGIRLCEKCRARLEAIHLRARRLLRKGHAEGAMTSLALAEALGEDPVFIRILVEEGLLEREEGGACPEASNRARLAAEFASELRRLGAGEDGRASRAEGMFFNRRRQQQSED
ncbi:MAG: hypothetical protein ACC613_04035 [Synergistales bacterium]